MVKYWAKRFRKNGFFGGTGHVGIFVNGKPVGEGKLIFPSGEEQTVFWKVDLMTVDGQVISFNPLSKQMFHVTP